MLCVLFRFHGIQKDLSSCNGWFKSLLARHSPHCSVSSSLSGSRSFHKLYRRTKPFLMIFLDRRNGDPYCQGIVISQRFLATLPLLFLFQSRERFIQFLHQKLCSRHRPFDFHPFPLALLAHHLDGERVQWMRIHHFARFGPFACYVKLLDGTWTNLPTPFEVIAGKDDTAMPAHIRN
jgi:hypothetical protein